MRVSGYRRGFTLTELAIVLGVAGVVLAGIWQFVGPVSDKAKINLLQAEILETVTNIRATLSGSPGIANAGAATLMTTLLNTSNPSLNTIPSALIRNPATNCSNTNSACADSPWGPYYPDSSTVDSSGTFQVCGWDVNRWKCGSTAAYTQLFAITIFGLQRGACLQLATSTSGGTAASGLVDIVINGTSILHLGAGHGLPVTSTDANAYCTQANLGNVLQYVYRVRAPS